MRENRLVIYAFVENFSGFLPQDKQNASLLPNFNEWHYHSIANIRLFLNVIIIIRFYEFRRMIYGWMEEGLVGGNKKLKKAEELLTRCQNQATLQQKMRTQNNSLIRFSTIVLHLTPLIINLRLCSSNVPESSCTFPSFKRLLNSVWVVSTGLLQSI